VLTWNIHKGVGGVDRRYALERIIEYVNEQDPDVALLQEVSEGWPATRFESQVSELLAGLRLAHHAFGHEHRYKRGGYGNAIYSRFPLHHVERIDLTIGWRKQRGALQARAVVRDGHHQRTIVLNNLHLGLAGTERAAQLRRFLADEALHRIHAATPVIVAGDLNDLYGTLGPRYLEPAGYQRAGTRVSTFPAAMPLRPLDAIFYRGDLEPLRCAAGRGELARSASDHRPLVAEFALRLT
jgi:endonuclease/exonuclease/phosphatase family metal-dependent hydrolase